MSKWKKVGSVLLAVSMLFALLPSAVSAKPTSGVSMIPIQEASFWETQDASGLYIPLNSSGVTVSTTIGENGAVTLKRTAEAPAVWAHIRSQQVEIRPEIDLKANPYVYFDLTATTNWNISFILNGVPMSIAKGITSGDPSKKQLSSPDEDGNPGIFKGKFNLYEYIQKEIDRIPQMRGKTTVLIPQVLLFIVDNTSDHLSGELTVRQLSMGNDDDSAAEGLKLDSSLAVDSDEGWEDLMASNTTHDPKDIPFADGAQAATTGPTGGMVPYILGGATIIVAVGAAVTLFILKKKKTGAAGETTDAGEGNHDETK
ncbi:MAG: hypothetical protein HFJ79_08330 [Clostridiales bacterium]|jgi:hypothetical protein|nr:hypothetical protein [Clostridiales bacterium]